ncbi:hypothetical protein KFU94_38880 [Chloroflexi bacterium TSY]|nr:hypothetical protein [Chloroflexi bacterium TSY]
MDLLRLINMVQDSVFATVLDALNALEVPYMIVGSYASNYWGRPRMTHDADLVIELNAHQATGLAQRLANEFYAPDFVIQEAAERGDHFNVIHLKTSFKIDFWLRKQNAYEKTCFERRLQGTMFDRKVWLTSAEDIILSKLLWYKMSPVLERQIQDVVEVYEIQLQYLDIDHIELYTAQQLLSGQNHHWRQVVDHSRVGAP